MIPERTMIDFAPSTNKEARMSSKLIVALDGTL